MRYKSIMSGVFSAAVLAGCQTTAMEDGSVVTLGADTTVHNSQHVYYTEFNSAQDLRVQTEQLAIRLGEFCRQEVGVESVQQQWHMTMLSWMALQGQERGPEMALEQNWNIQFWPDKKNTTGRKMRALTQQPNAATAEQISEQSVTVQGLGSIEWLLYDESSDWETNSTTCATGAAIGENLALNAKAVALAWQQNPWTELDEKQWQSEYIALLSNQLEYSMKKLSRPLADFGKPRPYFAESWRSKTSMLNVKANILALQTLYYAEGNGLDAILRQQGKQDLADRIQNQLHIMIETWPTDESLFTLLKTKEGYRNAYSQYNKLEQLKYLIHEEVAIELGVIIGFNATDGD